MPFPSFPIPKAPPKSPYATPDVPYVYQPYPRHVKSIHGKDAKGNPRTVTVNNADEEAYHTGTAAEIVVRENETHVEEATPEYKPQPYPRWIFSTLMNKRHVVNNHLEEEHHTGVVMNEDGTPAGEAEPEAPAPAAVVVAPVPNVKPKPPTLKEVIKAGYTKEVAEKIVEEEAGKARRGEKPYGDKEPQQPVQVGAGVPVDQLPPVEEGDWGK